MRPPPIAEIRRRLSTAFPEGVDVRSQLTRELAARTIATFLFVDAVGDPDADGRRLVRPSMVTWMDDESLARADDAAFVAGWHSAARRGQAQLAAFLEESGIHWRRWYADNSREPIRDEIIRPLNERYDAVRRRTGVAPADASPALSLTTDFAALFDTEPTTHEIEARIAAWREAHLGAGERARLAALRRLQRHEGAIRVVLPGRGERLLPAGVSSLITAAVIEELAPRVLTQPFVLAICHGRDPLAAEDTRELEQVDLALDPAVALPDVLLLDLASTTVWFVEVVVSGGPVHEQRREELLRWADARGLRAERCRFVTAYRSRADRVFRSTVGQLAWQTLAWFADEPTRIFRLEELLPEEPA